MTTTFTAVALTDAEHDHHRVPPRRRLDRRDLRAGDLDGLRGVPVVMAEDGRLLGRLGGLVCFEHTMNLARHPLIAKGEQVHAGSWPVAQNPATQERPLTAPIDLGGIAGVKTFVDATGHFSRREILQLNVDERPKDAARLDSAGEHNRAAAPVPAPGEPG